jgi:hypothetical protein
VKWHYVALVALALLAAQSLAASVGVTNTRLQTKYGTLTDVYFETASGPGGSTPSSNTAQTPSSSSGSFTIPPGTSGYLWSPQFTGATTISAGNWVFNFWAAAVAVAHSYVPITLTNSQGAPTPSSLQEKVTWNPSTYASYEASNLGNIRFCSDTACATQLNAWLETCALSCSSGASSASAWVKLLNSIAAYSSATIYMVFFPVSTTFDGSYWGEAPTLSSTYGQYDNGALVFTVYDNFAGTTVNSGLWTTHTAHGGGSSANNGLTLSTGASLASYANIRTTIQNYPAVFEAYVTSASSSFFMGLSTGTNEIGTHFPYPSYVQYVGTSDSMLATSSSSQTNLGSIDGTPRAGIYTFAWNSAYEYASDGTGSLVSTDNSQSVANYYAYMGIPTASPSLSSTVQWARIRAYPPSNVLPTVSFGAVSSNQVGVSIYITDSTGTVVVVVASNVQSPAIGPTEAQYAMTFAEGPLSILQTDYISVVVTASSSTTVYWGVGQPTNFQVPYRVLT